jgi:hypothetical protein
MIQAHNLGAHEVWTIVENQVSVSILFKQKKKTKKIGAEIIRVA